jgi:hypothetical protein
MAQDRRLWLNWEIFELATANPLLPGDISLERIRHVASPYPDPTVPLSFDEWRTRIAPTFKLNESQTEAVYTTLTCFLTDDPTTALLQSKFYMTNPSFVPCDSMRVTDMLVYLYAVFVKKKFRLVGERANLEAVPRKQESSSRISPHSTTLSRSWHAMPRAPLLPSSVRTESGYQAVERFFVSKLPAFLQIFAPAGLSRAHIESLGLVLQGGLSYSVRTKSLIAAMHLFRNRTAEAIDGFCRTVTSLLQAIVKDDEQAIRRDAPVTSPLAYRPVSDGAAGGDGPMVINTETFSERFIVIDPATFCDVYIDKCQGRKIYLCGAIPAVFLSHCKDTFVFVGAAKAVHLESCLNCRVVVAARLVQIDSSSGVRCSCCRTRDRLSRGTVRSLCSHRTMRCITSSDSISCASASTRS